MEDKQHCLFGSEIPELALRQRGKVRDVYEIDEHHLMIVTTDRISAFDVVLPTPIPGKGAVLTRLSNFWFDRMQGLVPNHLQLAERELVDVISDPDRRRALESRTVVVRKLEPLPIEAVVRGYIIGSGWKDYERTGSICGMPLPSGLRLAEQLDSPIFTPSSKAAVGSHDENITMKEMAERVGEVRSEQIRELSLALYASARDYAATRGIIIADTKFEFGIDKAGTLVLIDEVLTPDSSRFWPASEWQPGQNPPSFDKQFVRDYLQGLDWDKRPPAPTLPQEIADKTAAKYEEAQRLLME